MPSCFVVMGFGIKTDFQQNKSFDLDKTYQYIIKPAVEAAGFTCERADDIQHAGVIDVPMYDRLFKADLVVADLSTANLNAFFELGVRYALRPGTTIAVAEKGFKLPFDMSHILIRHYEHLGNGIDYGEVQRMQRELTAACRAIPTSGQIDSPVYIYIKDLVAPSIKGAVVAASVEAIAPAVAEAKAEREQRAREARAQATTKEEKDALAQPMAALLGTAMTARGQGNFALMRDILKGIQGVQGSNTDPFVVQQLALATYKARDREPKVALSDAKEALKALDPETSSDPETLGLWGAIHKRLWQLEALPREARLEALSTAIWAHEKAFYLKDDYYNGINLAFLLNVRAKQTSGEDAIADRVQAGRVRQRVLTICERLLAAGIKGESESARLAAEYWVLATAIEARFGLGKLTLTQALADAKGKAPEPWMYDDSTKPQLEALGSLLS